MRNIKVNGQKITTSAEDLLTLSKEFEGSYKTPIVLAIVNGKLQELQSAIKEGSEIEFLDILHKDGFRTYQRSLSFVMIKAAHEVFEEDIDVIVQFSINNGFYIDIEPCCLMNEEKLHQIQEKMMALIKRNLPFNKSVFKTDDAIDIFSNQRMEDKVNLLKYRRVSNINLYELDGLYDYFYGYMVPSTGYLNALFHLELHNDGFILQFLNKENPTEKDKFVPDQMLFDSLKKSTDWGHKMGFDNVADLNDHISKGRMSELILVQEAMMEKRLGVIADKILEDIDQKKFVFIAGPSSSGKTTFAHRLSVQLKSQGLNPKPISLDNYFVNREETPLDEDGNYDFECLEALDVAAFNKDMVNLLQGKEVSMPTFDFVAGERLYKGNKMILGERDILVIEGIHGLNPKMSYEIPEHNKFKIYISALTALNIDNHNRVPTTDARLLRRMVRDNQYRGASAEKTINMWPSVRRGEELYIFPFQEEADVMFNSALIYELSVLKQFAEPLLFNVDRNSSAYVEAKRLIKFLDYFLGYSSENIPNTSLIREFIGGSSFR